jgi:GNAT superfamily N-acetyltransferase
MAHITITEADLSRREHREAVVDLINSYAMDPMGNGKPLSPEVREALVPGLREHPTTMIFLAFREGRAVGIALCFKGFSTFAARPLVNIHDVAVLPEYRGKGIARRLLGAVEEKSRRIGCCKLTLEVLEYNTHARRVYKAAGFGDPRYNGGTGGTSFLVKELSRPVKRGGAE